MTVETHIHRARECVGDERASVAAKRDALGAFAEQVQSIETVEAGSERATAVTGPAVSTGGTAGQDQCRAVRTAFAETVALRDSPEDHDDPEAVLEAMRGHLGEQLALAVSPTTPAAFTPGLRDRLVSAVEARRRELSVTLGALDREAESLSRARGTVEEVTAWLETADATPLSELGFEALSARHRTLGTHRQSCGDVAERRQSLLGSTTSEGAAVGIAHDDLVAHLYEPFPVDYPVLASVARLLGLIEECRRAVRAHLVRRA